MGAQNLSSVLWKERNLLDLLTFKLEEEQLLLTAGKTRWIQHATQEVEQVMLQLRATGLERDIAVSAVSAEWNLPDDATLRVIAAHAPGPWGEIFSSHLAAMNELAAHIAELRDANEQFLRAAARSGQETLAGISKEPGTYNASGAAEATRPVASLLDKTL